ncbi:MAG: diguanylate cyclase [Pseudorhodobacter sp.]
MPGRILIVDDVATNRIVFKVKLGAACYEPILAEDGAACLALARKHKPDLILLDMILPDMTAPHILRALRADPQTAAIPVVVISADTDPESRMAALSAGADDFLGKTVPDETLLARLRNLVREYEETSETESDDIALRAFGFADSHHAFETPGLVAIVSYRRERAMRLRDALNPHLIEQTIVSTREEALSKRCVGPIPDIFVIETNPNDSMGHLRLVSELRSRQETRHSGICVIQPGTTATATVMGYDLGANDCLSGDIPPGEMALRLRRILTRKREADRIRASVRDGLRLAVEDPLTGLYNRRYALSRLTNIAETARQTGGSFAVMVVDLDRFKQVNDCYGHAAGDCVLIEAARRLAANIRGSDLLARIGGEEFLIALPGSDLAQARPVAERLCLAINQAVFDLPGQEKLRVTCSIGLAISDGGMALHLEEIIDRADQALLLAKTAGRNQVTISRSAA